MLFTLTYPVVICPVISRHITITYIDLTINIFLHYSSVGSLNNALILFTFPVRHVGVYGKACFVVFITYSG